MKFLKKAYNYLKYIVTRFIFIITFKKCMVREYWALSGVAERSDDVRKYWEDRGASYVNEARRNQIVCGKFTPDPRQLKTKEIMDKLNIQPQNLLELGCGFGRNIKFFNQYFQIKDLTGIDFSSNILKTAKKYLKGLDCKLYNGDIKNLPFDNNSFDMVYSYGVLMYIKPCEIEQILKEALRVSKNYVVFSELIYDEKAQYGWKGWDGSYKHNYKEILSKLNGFEILYNGVVSDSDTYILRKKNEKIL